MQEWGGEMRRYFVPSRKKNEKGQTLVEFALVLPILLILVLGIIQFGIILNGQVTVTSAAREGARFGVVGEDEDAVKTRVKNALAGSLLIDPNSADIDVTYPTMSGEELTVYVQYNMPVIVPLVFPGGVNSFSVEATSKMRAEKLP